MNATLRQYHRPLRLSPQHETVLNLWGDGLEGATIAERVSIQTNTVHCIVARARRRLDQRAVLRAKPVYIPANLHATISREAEARGTDAAGIVTAVLTNAFASEWFLKVVLNEDDE